MYNNSESNLLTRLSLKSIPNKQRKAKKSLKKSWKFKINGCNLQLVCLMFWYPFVSFVVYFFYLFFLLLKFAYSNVLYDAGTLMCCICYCVIKKEERSIIYTQHFYITVLGWSSKKIRAKEREQWPDARILTT